MWWALRSVCRVDCAGLQGPLSWLSFVLQNIQTFRMFHTYREETLETCWAAFQNHQRARNSYPAWGKRNILLPANFLSPLKWTWGIFQRERAFASLGRLVCSKCQAYDQDSHTSNVSTLIRSWERVPHWSNIPHQVGQQPANFNGKSPLPMSYNSWRVSATKDNSSPKPPFATGF